MGDSYDILPDLHPYSVLHQPDLYSTSDLGYRDSAVLSPTIDALAKGGVRLSSHYVHNWCAPSRAMLMTGRQFELHIGQTGGGGTGHTNGVPLNLTFLPEALKQANYKTAFLGKCE